MSRVKKNIFNNKKCNQDSILPIGNQVSTLNAVILPDIKSAILMDWLNYNSGFKMMFQITSSTFLENEEQWWKECE